MLLVVLAMAEMVSGAAQSATQATEVMTAAAPAVPQTSAGMASPPAAPDPDTADAASPAAGAANPAPAVPATSAPGSPAEASPVPEPAPDTAGTKTSVTSAQNSYLVTPRDPWIKVNRKIYAFDMSLERSLLAPVAHGYSHVVPHVVRFHVTSALLNLGEPLTATDDFLQLRIGSMSKAVFRFIINSTVGIAGLFDVAGASGVPQHISDFGQTLGRYGVRTGPYVMLPLLGPSNVRDGFGRLVDTFLDPMQFLIGGITSPEGASLFVFEGLDWRARSDDTMKAVYDATDPYAFVRSAYTQTRAAAVLQATGKQAALPDFDAEPGTR